MCRFIPHQAIEVVPEDYLFGYDQPIDGLNDDIFLVLATYKGQIKAKYQCEIRVV